jgi:hypothetical protein
MHIHRLENYLGGVADILIRYRNVRVGSEQSVQSNCADAALEAAYKKHVRDLLFQELFISLGRQVKDFYACVSQ